MQENARQGFWNGSKLPYGYAVMATEQRGSRTKKRLAIDPVEAEVVRLMFKLFREGDGASGPMGVKAVTNWLNVHGYRSRLGARWGKGALHQILTRRTYRGEHRFNRKVGKTRQQSRTQTRFLLPSIPSSTPRCLRPCRPRSTPGTRESCRHESSPGQSS
jgi:hypothetical protein